jgi:hypothetical protein
VTRRGPAGPVPGPPADLASRDLPLLDAQRGSRFCRIHRTGRDAIFFSPGPGKPPAGRFDSATGRFGVLYAGLSLDCAFAEVLLRNPARSIVSLSEVAARSFVAIGLHADIRLVDLTGPGLSRLGLDARVLSGGYEVCGAWADALHDHRERPAGILYPSRFDPSERCVALFDRAAPHLDPGTESVPLGERPHDVAAALDRYGKALDPG